MSGPQNGTPKRTNGIRPHTVAQVDKPVSIIPPQEMGYYEGQSPDFCLELIPADVQRVLDIGCGRGWLGRALKQHGVQEVVGIEHFAPAAEEAQQHLDAVFTADIETVALEYPAGYFDCIVYSGVLEHVRDPWHVLYEHRRVLNDTGTAVALLPNVQHFSVILDLLQGRWPYQASGQLDATHYRFFTRAEAIRMFESTGFRMEAMKGHQLFARPPEVERLANALQGTGLVTPEFIQDLGVYIWVLRARKDAAWIPPERKPEPVRIAGVGIVGTEPQPAPATPAPHPAPTASPTTSIVIASYNSKADLEQCLASITAGSRTTHEIIVVDNASTDGTAEWLQQRTDIVAVLNDTNRGFSVATNQGLRLARGEYCILLNPDTIVTDGWDERLVAHAAQPGVGAVGPVANGNSCCGWQRVDMWVKDRLEGEQNIATVAAKVAQWYPRQSRETKLLTGFCLCVPKRVFDEVGLLDENLFMGNDDVDLSLRLQWAGYKLLVALDAFILHKGMGSFRDVDDSVRARYIQESTDVLYAKLEEKFGKGNVPPWPELIELPWHLPSHHRGDEFTGERANPYSPNMRPDIMREHWARYEMARRYAEGKHVLDAACGTGYGSRHLAEVAASVTGCDVDPDTVAYAHAKSAHTNVRFSAGDVRHLPLADQRFDVITSFETIEHVKEGREVLAEFQRLLKPDGVLLVSTPLGSADGNPYHFAHYNRADFIPLLEEYFGEVDMRYQQGDAIYTDPKTPLVAERFMDEYAIAICRRPKTAARVAEQFTPRNGTVAAAPAAAEETAGTPGDALMVSIIIPAWNELHHTRMCIESIRAHTPEPHEILVIDNGSTDGTGDWLATQADVRTITNAENRGFAAACNQGMEAAQGAYLVLLNNDTVVTPRWITRLANAIEKNPDVGLVGPKSNSVGGPQIDPSARYNDVAGMLEHSQALATECAENWEDTYCLSGFCVMLPRSVYETLGGLDERFGVGMYEDNDYCKRLAMQGLRMLIAHDTFIHHECSVTFKSAGIDYGSQMAKNRAVFEAKWTDDPTLQGANAYEAGDLERAAEHFRAAIEATPAYADPYRNLSAVYVRLRRWADAAETLERLCELRPLQWPARTELAKTYRRLGRIEDAATTVQPLLNSKHLGPGLRAEALVIAGDAAACAADWETAERAFRAALAARDNFAGAWNGMGLVAHHAGAADEARQSFERASALDESAADPLSNLGVLEWQAGDTTAALQRFEAALDRDPLHANALDNFVAAALAEGRVDNARGRIEAALTAQPDSAHAQELLALCEAS